MSKAKKFFLIGLSVTLSVSLSCGMCTCAYSNEDYKQMIQDHKRCLVEKAHCSNSCWDAKKGATDTIPDFCGGDTISTLRGSLFPRCEVEYLVCKQKALRNLNLIERLEIWWNLRGKSADEIGVLKEDFDNFLKLLGNSLSDFPLESCSPDHKKAVESIDRKLFWLKMNLGYIVATLVRVLTGLVAVSQLSVVGLIVLRGMRNPKFKNIIR